MDPSPAAAAAAAAAAAPLDPCTAMVVDELTTPEGAEQVSTAVGPETRLTLETRATAAAAFAQLTVGLDCAAAVANGTPVTTVGGLATTVGDSSLYMYE